MLEQYLRRIGLDNHSVGLNQTTLNRIVEEALQSAPILLTTEEAQSLYTYLVPKMEGDVACSLTKERETYSLLPLYGIESAGPLLPSHPMTTRLLRLNAIADKLQELVNIDWIGIYRRVMRADGVEVLVKEAYRGEISRAEFPLTVAFAAQSNNSTVGMTGKAALIENVASCSGPYYACDSRVQSELCVPIFSPSEEVIGIIDAESWTKAFFTAEKIHQITTVAVDLGQINLLLS